MPGSHAPQRSRPPWGQGGVRPTPPQEGAGAARGGGQRHQDRGRRGGPLRPDAGQAAGAARVARPTSRRRGSPLGVGGDPPPEGSPDLNAWCLATQPISGRHSGVPSPGLGSRTPPVDLLRLLRFTCCRSLSPKPNPSGSLELCNVCIWGQTPGLTDRIVWIFSSPKSLILWGAKRELITKEYGQNFSNKRFA